MALASASLAGLANAILSRDYEAFLQAVDDFIRGGTIDTQDMAAAMSLLPSPGYICTGNHLTSQQVMLVAGMNERLESYELQLLLSPFVPSSAYGSMQADMAPRSESRVACQQLLSYELDIAASSEKRSLLLLQRHLLTSRLLCLQSLYGPGYLRGVAGFELEVAVVRWHFWLSILKTPADIEAFSGTLHNDRRSRKDSVYVLTVILERAKATTFEAISFLKRYGRPPASINPNVSRTLLRCYRDARLPIIPSDMPAMDLQASNLIQAYDAGLLVFLQGDYNPRLAILDTGCGISRIRRDIVEHSNNVTGNGTIKFLAQPYVSRGVHGSGVEKYYADVEIYIPVTFENSDGQIQLAKISHQFVVVDSGMDDMLIGMDIIARHGLTISPVTKQVSIAACGGAIAQLQLRRFQVAQDMLSEAETARLVAKLENDARVRTRNLK
jgi:hypothetical protein